MVTVLGPDASQVDYRLSPQCGHDQARARDAALTYRLALDVGSRPIERIGSGWVEFGHSPGSGSVLVDDADVQAVREVMAGRDPVSGQWLVKPKMAVHPAAKLAARPLVEALCAAAEPTGEAPGALFAPELAKRFARLERGLHRDGEAHRAPVGDLETLAAAVGVDLAAVYDGQELAEAQIHRDERVRVGNRGYDVTIDMPKSVSVLWGLADTGTAQRIEELYLQAVRESIGALEGWTAYGLSGHHGDGQRAQRLDTSGFTGTITLHRTARPVGAAVGDPHLHAHVMLANLVKCSDGQWRTVAAGGRDLHRHVAAVGELARARVRDLLSSELGVRWEHNVHSGRWEITGVPSEVRSVFSQRSRQIVAETGEEATPAAQRSVGRQFAGAKHDLSPAEERQAWRDRAERAGVSPERLVADALGHDPPDNERDPGPSGPRPPRPDPAAVAAVVWDPETGVTASTKTVTRAKVMAAVANACPSGLESTRELEELTDAVLDDARAVALPPSGQAHMANAARYTSADIVHAERTIVDSTLRRTAQVAAAPMAIAHSALERFEQRNRFRLSDPQRQVVRRLLTAGHGIDAVIGVAGAGKTTIMAACREGWEAQGLTVAGAATAAVAAAGLQADAGVASRTIASWLHRINAGPGLDGVDVLVIDEAAMVNDRDFVRLVVEAERTGTKIVGIGDPKQLHAVGVGGAFKRIHQITGGLTLPENRRQRAALDRDALAVWREGGRHTALAAWGEAGRVHASRSTSDAYARITAAWWRDRDQYTDPYDAVAGVLVLAARNSDVEELNARCRVVAREAGYLRGGDVTWRTAGGTQLTLASGDQIRVRRNDYRSRRDATQADVLNGFRGVVSAVDERYGAQIRWRDATGTTRSAWIPPEDIARGALSLGYASTIASAQGATCASAHVLGTGADAHSLYPAMSRARDRTDLYLPGLGELEDPGRAAVVGTPRDAQEELHRAIAAYAATLDDPDDGMVLDALAGHTYGLEDTTDEETRPSITPAPPERYPRDAGRRVVDDSAHDAQTPQHLTRADAYAGRGPAAQEARKEMAANRAALELTQSRIPGLRVAYLAAQKNAAQGRMTLRLSGTSRTQALAEAEKARQDLDRALAEVKQASSADQEIWQRAIETDMAEATREEKEAELDEQERVFGIPREELERFSVEARRAILDGIKARDTALQGTPSSANTRRLLNYEQAKHEHAVVPAVAPGGHARDDGPEKS